MAKPNRTEITLWILAGIGAGTLIGASVGLALGRRPRRSTDAQSVDELKEKAQQVLGELSESVSDLIGRSRQLQPNTDGLS